MEEWCAETDLCHFLVSLFKFTEIYYVLMSADARRILCRNIFILLCSKKFGDISSVVTTATGGLAGLPISQDLISVESKGTG
jgi:hypothetical protein